MQKDALPTERREAGRCIPRESYSYPLPKGLKTLVKLIAFDHGYWKVEADGQVFENVFLGSVESGWLYELNGRWLDESDPRVIAERKQTSLGSSPYFSCVNGGCVLPPQ